MMTKFPPRRIDSIDRDIIRNLYARRSPMTGHSIANKVNISSPAIRPRLDKLYRQGIVKPFSHTCVRTFNRKFGNVTKKISSPRSIFWGLDISKREKKFNNKWDRFDF